MILFVPKIGSHLKLTKPFKFTLYVESRNIKLCEAVDNHHYTVKYGYANVSQYEYQYTGARPLREIEIPVGMILSVDRIYIRKGAEGFDSISFKTVDAKDPIWKGKRFWVKLNELNGKMEFEVVK